MAMKEPIRIIKCIKVIHPQKDIREYRVLSAFFRFMGIFVCENTHGNEYGDETDVTLMIDREDKDVSNLGVEMEVIQNALNHLTEENVDEAVVTILGHIAEVFCRYDLMRGSYAIEYFGDSGEAYIYRCMLDAYERFMQALADLEAFRTTEAPALIYVLASSCNCKRRMNEIRKIIWNAIQSGLYGETDEEKLAHKEDIWRRKFYPFGDINQDLNRIKEIAPDFYGADAIRGFAAELDDNYKLKAVYMFEDAFRGIGAHTYSSYILYRIGLLYEKVHENHKAKWEYYQLSYKLDQHNYRVLYKIAIIAKNNNQWDEEIALWKALLEILEYKKELSALQPVECAYLYKTYYNLGVAWLKKENYGRSIDYLKKAESIYLNRYNEVGDSAFYSWMFKFDKVDMDSKGRLSWQIYKEAARRKLRINLCYTAIYEAAGRSNLYDLYKEYYGKSLNKEV